MSYVHGAWGPVAFPPRRLHLEFHRDYLGTLPKVGRAGGTEGPPSGTTCFRIPTSLQPHGKADPFAKSRGSSTRAPLTRSSSCLDVNLSTRRHVPLQIKDAPGDLPEGTNLRQSPQDASSSADPARAGTLLPEWRSRIHEPGWVQARVVRLHGPRHGEAQRNDCR